jgi:hypothetical protein
MFSHLDSLQSIVRTMPPDAGLLDKARAEVFQMLEAARAEFCKSDVFKRWASLPARIAEAQKSLDQASEDAAKFRALADRGEPGAEAKLIDCQAKHTAAQTRLAELESQQSTARIAAEVAWQRQFDAERSRLLAHVCQRAANAATAELMEKLAKVLNGFRLLALQALTLEDALTVSHLRQLPPT